MNIRLTTFPEGTFLADKTARIDGTSDGAGTLYVMVDEHGVVSVNGERTHITLADGARLNLIGAARFTLCSGSVVPNPTATLQAFNTVPGDTTAVVSLNFFPTVQ